MAGENLDECKKLIQYLDSVDIQTMINYMMEYLPGKLSIWAIFSINL